ncbi:MAG: response regulator transcription factor [Planctomycetota bacterium]
MRVLLVEDSERLQRSIAAGLRGAGFAVDVAGDGKEGLLNAQANDYDVVVLDIMLPGLDGLNVLQALRAAERPARVLLLTAKDTIQDRVKGLELGADDYLVKPFAFEELRARVQALVRRRHGVTTPVLRAGPLELDTTTLTVRWHGDEIDLAPREYALLEYLLQRRSHVVSRSDIEAHIYDEQAEPMSNVVDAAIYALRRKLERPGEPSPIRTRRGHGYQLDLPE